MFSLCVVCRRGDCCRSPSISPETVTVQTFLVKVLPVPPALCCEGQSLRLRPCCRSPTASCCWRISLIYGPRPRHIAVSVPSPEMLTPSDPPFCRIYVETGRHFDEFCSLCTLRTILPFSPPRPSSLTSLGRTFSGRKHGGFFQFPAGVRATGRRFCCCCLYGFPSELLITYSDSFYLLVHARSRPKFAEGGRSLGFLVQETKERPRRIGNSETLSFHRCQIYDSIDPGSLRYIWHSIADVSKMAAGRNVGDRLTFATAVEEHKMAGSRWRWPTKKGRRLWICSLSAVGSRTRGDPGTVNRSQGRERRRHWRCLRGQRKEEGQDYGLKDKGFSRATKFRGFQTKPKRWQGKDNRIYKGFLKGDKVQKQR